METLRWLIHIPFLHYAEELPDCTIEVTDGASRAEDGSFVFPLTTRRTSADRTTLQSHGHVAIRAYEGMLSVALINPRLELNGDSGRLFTENPYRTADFVPIAEISAATESGRTTSAATFLTSQGVGWLSDGRYPAGQQAAPLTWTSAAGSLITDSAGGTPGERSRSAGRTRG